MCGLLKRNTIAALCSEKCGKMLQKLIIMFSPCLLQSENWFLACTFLEGNNTPLFTMCLQFAEQIVVFKTFFASCPISGKQIKGPEWGHKYRIGRQTFLDRDISSKLVLLYYIISSMRAEVMTAPIPAVSPVCCTW